MTIPLPTGNVDVSPRALAIARQIDRLAAGSYYIHVEKIDAKDQQWNVRIVGEIMVKELKVYIPKEDKQE